MNFDVSYFIAVFPQLLKYIPLTLMMAVVAMIVSIGLGFLITLMKLSKFRILNKIGNVYISFFRGMPGLVQLFLIFYGLPQLFPVFKGISAVFAVILGLGFKNSAYLAEIFRSAILSVDKGQIEAGKSLKISDWKIYVYILLPQAFVNALPATGNIFISLIKETSLAFALGITEIFAEGKIIAGSSFRYLETYLAVGIIYWGLVIVYSWLQSLIERKVGVPYR
ncbi:amino acid ABC transporter permease [Fructilactobacillus vespulae]|uniref:amino acid ABC transporter permease n=1 Tax=Fructilactobacillus vespulae TaxID=1249630 RepID=UPI0039B66BCC